MRKSLKISLGLLGITAASFVVIAMVRKTPGPGTAPLVPPPLAPKASATPQHKRLSKSQKNDTYFASLARVASASSSAEARSALQAARSELLNHRDGAAATDALIKLLEQGHDVSLQAQMQVGVGGELKDAPTSRVALLDLLGQMDSELAAEYSRQLLQNSTSSDEWAIALRNYAWGVDNAASDPFLRAKVYELLTNNSWSTAPTAGFLEALDFVPYTQDPTLIAPLVNLAKEAQPNSVRRAAFFALERFVSQETTSGLSAVAQAEVTEPFSALRADTMARADLTRPSDVQIVQDYLLSTQIDPKEFELFATMFPHGGRFAGPSLATSFQPKPLTELAKRDAQALSVIQNWMGDSAFANRHHELTQIFERLVRLNESAVQGGYL